MNTPQLSMFKSARAIAPEKTATVAETVELIRSDRLKPDIERLRGCLAAGNRAAYDEGKKCLPAVTWAGTFKARCKAGLVAPSGLVVVDLDHIGDKMPIVRAVLVADPSVVACFTSPSGDGLKAVAAVSDTSDHGRAWRAVADRVKAETGIEPDPTGKDVSRLCFLSHDPNAYHNPAPVPVDIPAEPPKSEPQQAAAVSSSTRVVNDARSALDKAVAAVCGAADGKRNATLNTEAYTIGQLIAGGVLDEVETVEALRRAAVGAGLSDDEIQKTIKSGIEAGKQKPRGIPEAGPVAGTKDEENRDTHRNQPRPDPSMLYGLAGDVARAAAETTEANPYAVAAGFLSFLSAAIGRNAYLSVGNTRHHARLFALHVGRTSRGRKGDALSIVKRIRRILAGKEEAASSTQDGIVAFPGQVHHGGLSTREGLALLLHDAMLQGKDEIPAIDDKRLWIIEHEFANVLQQGKRDGNTLSSALRDAWDGESIRPATKCARVWATEPHISIAGAITPGELRSLLDAGSMLNGFANRFMIFWAERDKLISRPKPTPGAVVDDLARRTHAVIEFAKGDYPRVKDGIEFGIAEAASRRYDELYRGELNRCGYGALVDALLERRAPTLLRLAMLFAMTDHEMIISTRHIDAAWAWVRYWVDSARFIFSDEGELEAEEKRDIAEKIIDFLRAHGEVTRTAIMTECFAGHTSGERVDAALSDLLAETPPRVEVRIGPKAANNKRAKFYKLRESRESGETEGLKPIYGDSHGCEVRETAPAELHPRVSDSPSSQVSESPESPTSSPTAPSLPVSQDVSEPADGWGEI